MYVCVNLDMYQYIYPNSVYPIPILSSSATCTNNVYCEIGKIILFEIHSVKIIQVE